MKEYERLQVGSSGWLYEHDVVKLYQQNSACWLFIMQENLQKSLA